EAAQVRSMRLLLRAVAVKLDGAVGGDRFTTSARVVVRVRLPLTPVIVRVKAPVGVLELVITERVEDAVAGFGSKEPLAPLGSPSKLRLAWPVKPPVALIMTLYFVEPPCATVALDGEALSVKSLGWTNRSRMFAVVCWMRGSTRVAPLP